MTIFRPGSYFIRGLFHSFIIIEAFLFSILSCETAKAYDTEKKFQIKKVHTKLSNPIL
ncbi:MULTISPECIES: hypothetical protein [Bacillus cereus group]|uniref:hypothetical protein n=1 Tax=Bacillus cereus group TaxID=86661 RepID=UPI001561A1BB|nr:MULTISPECIES: hypothetical protein [Bacillus cereus group]